MFNCPVCSQKCQNRKALSGHITRKHASLGMSPLEKEKLIVYTIFSESVVEDTVRRYLLEEFPLSKAPIDISLYVKLLGIKRTHSEEKKTRGYKERITSSIEKKYGVRVDNISQVPEIKEKIREAAKLNYPEQRSSMLKGFLEFCKDPERVERMVAKIEETCLLRYGNKNFGGGEEARSKRINSLRDFIASLSYEEKLERTSVAREAVCHRGGYSSKPEKRVRACLERLGIQARYNVHMWNYNFDMVWSDIILEVQGDMWHANPSLYKAEDLIMGKLLAKDIWDKDEKKRKVAVSNGFTFIEIWENEIRSCKTDEALTEFLHTLLKRNHDFS